jgi:hypothetical protein
MSLHCNPLKSDGGNDCAASGGSEVRANSNAAQAISDADRKRETAREMFITPQIVTVKGPRDQARTKKYSQNLSG